ncbi:MAG: N-acetylglucosamine-6-phosphate deacetylase [Runella slithyformis]|nr:MAG: N-acetylglucosamine-6-phosphate deacetylase [Runella slithyformis]
MNKKMVFPNKISYFFQIKYCISNNTLTFMLALTNVRVFTGDTVLTNHAVLLKNERIEAVLPKNQLPANYQSIDLQGQDITAGFLDIQLYGGDTDFFVQDLSAASLQNMVNTHLQDGTTSLMPTLYSTTQTRILKAIEIVKKWIAAGKTGVLGLHIEGPYLNFAKRGAHSAAVVRPPVEAELTEIIAQSEGLLTLMTIAPEIWPVELLQLLQKSHLLLSMGHTNATYQQAKGYFEGGIKMATHLYNAMRPFESREPGVVGAIFDAPDDVHASIIADGFHCDFAAIRLAKKILGARLFLISDATFAKYQQTRFEFEGFSANYDGQRFLNDDGNLAGSAITLLQAVQNCVFEVGIPKDEAFRMAAQYPAQRLGLGHRLGQIKAGYQADLVVLGQDLTIKKVFVKGQEVRI